ncbi:MAG: IspD/TarI family cytidylyltransferase, partial [Pseudomonadota bacterium]
MSVQKGLPVKVLIAAAGSSERYGTDIPKQYQKINGKTVLRHTIEKFLKVPDIDDIRVIINPSDADLYHDAVQGLNLPPYIEGSNSRKNSVYNGLKSFSDVKNNFKILIHDAARPLVSPEDIQVVIDTLDHNQAATLGRKVPDTLRKSNYAALDRDNTWLIQTPQGFSYQDIWKAHETFKDRDDFTDDASLIAEMGGQVHILQSTSP